MYLSLGFTCKIINGQERPMCLLCMNTLASDSMKPRETLVLPAAIDIIATMFGESYADQIKSIPLADNTVGRRISDISDDLCDQLIEKIKLSSFALQVDEATDVAKDAHLITYIRYVMENDIREELLFCKAIEGKATNCVGLCTDGAPSMAGKNAGLQALVRKVAPRAVWTHCMIHRQSLVARNMGEELLESIKRKAFGKLCDDMGSEYKALLLYCEARWLSRAKVLQRVFELKKEIAIFLADN
ncbi:protein FAM200A-like [Ctenocephalides felis]|uniref:protein FAM200A-like n=1 Tax=Ctenocephalides felis TaxID=7515 RepID=UPI000E6E29D0|nr:protein FAM200A-like [Ctenocephalides felis]